MRTNSPNFREGGNPITPKAQAKKGNLIKIITLFFILASFSCKEKPSETDNLFRYKEYISYTTSGIQPVQTAIRVEVAKSLTQFEIDEEIPQDIVTISPKVSGTLSVRNQRLLEFTPIEPLKPDTEYSVTVHLKSCTTIWTVGWRSFSSDLRPLLQILR